MLSVPLTRTRWLVLLALAATGALPTATRALEPATELRLPLDNYPIDDTCGPWGWFNSNFQRCGMPGKHVADDACAPAGTMVYAVGPGRIMHGSQVGNCLSNWGWLTVVEHIRPDGSKFCSIYGHCRPLPGMIPGLEVTKGQAIATVDFPCGSQHIHFGMALGGFDIDLGYYPSWLLGYLPDGTTCDGQPVAFPGRYVEPVQFVMDTVPVVPVTWSSVKARER